MINSKFLTAPSKAGANVNNLVTPLRLFTGMSSTSKVCLTDLYHVWFLLEWYFHNCSTIRNGGIIAGISSKGGQNLSNNIICLKKFLRVCLQFFHALTKMQTFIKKGLPFVTSQGWWIYQTLQSSRRQCNEHTAIEQAVSKAQYTNPTKLIKFSDMHWSTQQFNRLTVFMFRHRSVPMSHV